MKMRTYESLKAPVHSFSPQGLRSRTKQSFSRPLNKERGKDRDKVRYKSQ